MLPPTPSHSNSFLSHFHLFPLFSAHVHSFSPHSYALPLMFSPVLFILSPLPPINSFSHPFKVHIQIIPPNPTQHLIFQPVPVFYVPTYFMYLCAYVPLYFTCSCAYVIHYMHFTAYAYILYVPFRELIRQAYLFTLPFSKKIIVIPTFFLL